MWLHSLKVAQLLRSAACLHTNQSRSYLNHLVLPIFREIIAVFFVNLKKSINILHGRKVVILKLDTDGIQFILSIMF